MFRVGTLVFTPGARLTCDVACTTLLIEVDGVERDPTQAEIESFLNGYRIVFQTRHSIRSEA